MSNLEDDDNTKSSDDSSTSSSSQDSFRNKADIEADDIKLAQMRRGAQKRGGQRKMNARMQDLKSYEQLQKEHEFKRMKDGLEKILSLHNPVELSSICGCLALKVQEKGSTSTRFIMEYAMELGEFNEQRMLKILNFMWEGALWEYLHSIGHPIHTMRLDPKVTVLELWHKGGLLGDGIRGFVPHFVAREVKKRNDWIQSPDIQQRLEELRNAQDKAKAAEKRVVAEHDYTNILSYFNQIGALRRMENSVREYLISEVEILRSRHDSAQESAKITRQQLAENETHYMKIVNSINEQLGFTEHVCEQQIQERCRLEGEMQRLMNVFDSYIQAELNRQQPGGGTIQPMKLRHLEECSPTIRAIHRQMQQYRQMRDNVDSALRAQARTHSGELSRLSELVDALQAELETTSENLLKQTTRADKAEEELFYCRRKLARTENLQQILTNQAWQSSEKFAAKANVLERSIQSLRPLLREGLKSRHKTVYQISRALLRKFDLLPEEEIVRTLNAVGMSRMDVFSRAAQDFYEKQQELLNDPLAASGRMKSMKGKKKGGKSSKSGKSGKSGKAGGKSSKSGKDGSVSGKSSRATTPSERSRPGTADSSGFSDSEAEKSSISVKKSPKPSSSSKSPATKSAKKKKK